MCIPRSMVWFFLIALPLPLAGCGPSVEERLIGTWQADTSGKLAELQAQAESNPLAGLAAKAAESASITVEFKPEGKLAFNRKIGVISIDTVGAWQVVDPSADPPQIEMRYPKSGTGVELVHQTTVTFENDNRIQMSMRLFGDQVEVLPYDRLMEE